MATRYDPSWYKAWHTWALANFDVIGYAESNSKTAGIGGERLAQHVVQSVEGKATIFS
jgi:FKBP12-rapamycin complex-associated protein